MGYGVTAKLAAPCLATGIVDSNRTLRPRKNKEGSVSEARSASSQTRSLITGDSRLKPKFRSCRDPVPEPGAESLF